MLIRGLTEADAEIITREEIAQSRVQTIDKYLMRLDDARQEKCISLAAEYEGNVAGYGTRSGSAWGFTKVTAVPGGCT